MVSLSDASAVYYGDKPVQAIYYGQTKIWPSKMQHWVFDFEEPGTWEITAPAGARYLHYILYAGGNSGQRGDGALSSPGLGGRGGKGNMGRNLEVPGSGGGHVIIGKGGVEPNYSGEASRINWGEFVRESLANTPLFTSTSNGEHMFWDGPEIVGKYSAIPGLLDNKKVFLQNGGIHAAVGGEYKGGAGTPGVRGGGGSGGEGGTFGRFSPGGAGGDGFCRIVFTDRKIA